MNHGMTLKSDSSFGLCRKTSTVAGSICFTFSKSLNSMAYSSQGRTTKTKGQQT